MKFGEKLHDTLETEWRAAYIDYDLLKVIINEALIELADCEGSVALEDRASRRKAVKAQAVSRFEAQLDAEIEKTALFFLEEQGILARKLAHAASILKEKKEEAKGGQISAETFGSLRGELRTIGAPLVSLVDFIYLNSNALRKILKKHDKNFGTRLSVTFVAARASKEYNYIGIFMIQSGLSVLAKSYTDTFVDVYNAFKPSSDASEEVAEHEPIVNDLFKSMNRVKTTNTFYNRLNKHAGIFEEVSFDVLENRKRERTSNVSFTLNAASAFLYMSSYYIVAPTAGLYAEHLGATPALSGIIIAGAPIAGIASALLYSWWSNKSFKSPLVFCSVCCIIGSALYSLAYTFDSFVLVMVGRLLTGFGGARAVNRRFIADHCSAENRMKRSAEFVAASALGMAGGPALSSLIAFLPSHFTFGPLQWNPLTSCGWVMTVIWLVYLIFVIRLFEEPKKNGPEPNGMLRRDDSNSLSRISVTESRSLLNMAPKPNILETVRSNKPLAFCLCVYFYIKFIGDLFISSLPIVCSYYFGWSTELSGWFIACLGLCMLPLDNIISVAGSYLSDREIMKASLTALTVGCLVIVPNFATYTALQYGLAGLTIFSMSNLSEAVLMSILARLMPKHLAKGTFNSGLLSTECGMSGRAAGSIGVTLSSLAGMDNLLRLAFIPVTLVGGLVLVALDGVYGGLEKDAE